jgi:hypothetical protein
MSIVRMPGVCYCECHDPGRRVMHCAPCCRGKCSVCRQNYKSESHYDQCVLRKWTPFMEDKVPQENRLECARELEAKSEELRPYSFGGEWDKASKQVETALPEILRRYEV